MMETEEDVAIEERLQKAAIDLLVTQGEQYASALLLSCGLRWTFSNEGWMVHATRVEGIDVTLTGPPGLYQILRGISGLAGRQSGNQSHTAAVIRDALEAAIDATMSDSYLDSIWIKMETRPPFPGWRDEYLSELRGDTTPSNQAIVARHVPAFSWNGLCFRSRTEQVLAEAFSRTGVLFFPLAAAMSRAQKYEPDFLVCSGQGKWGILEVHGDDFHPPETAAKEHERGRWFQERGVRFFQVFNATECFNNPDGVVDRFLKLLAGS